MNLPNLDQTGPDQAGQPDLLQLGPAGAAARLVLLHGWGADAHDLLDLGEMLVGPELSVVALQAPEPHPLGVGRQWYGLQPIDWGQLPAARAALRQRLEQLASSVPLGRTVVLGFSQGGAMALDVASGLPVAGIVACSGYPHEGWQPCRCRPCCSAMANRTRWCHLPPVKKPANGWSAVAAAPSYWPLRAATRSIRPCCPTSPTSWPPAWANHAEIPWESLISAAPMGCSRVGELT